MTDLHPGAAKLSSRHISIRVPWHDTDWTGKVCGEPSKNASCIVLENIHSKKEDAFEDEQAGREWPDILGKDLPPCVAERAGFMRPYAMSHQRRHPYSHNESHQHLAPTTLEMPAYSAMAVPFRWMLRGNTDELSEQFELGVRPDLEDRADDVIGFDSAWVQDGRNQRVMLDTFFSALEPAKSLVFFYAKSVPLVDHQPGQRVLIGAGRVTSVGTPTEWSYTQEGPINTWLWERAVGHSIRPAMDDGFLLPYQGLLDELGPGADFTPYVAMAPDDHWLDYSYTSEHVSHDGAIASLLKLIESVEATREVVDGPWAKVLAWCDQRLNELWTYRGPAPGIGSALVALGLERGTILANRIEQDLAPNQDPWPVVERAFRDAPAGKGPAAGIVGETQAKVLANLPDERRQLLKLLSSFALSADQAKRLFRGNERAAAGIDASDADLLSNPYLLYELDRYSELPVNLSTVDRGVFPEDVVRSQHPLPVSEPVSEAVDPRRVRAWSVNALERFAAEGDTVVPRDRLIAAVIDAPVKPGVALTVDVLPVVQSYFEPFVRSVDLGEGGAFQLDRLAADGRLIRKTVDKRLQAKRHDVKADWRARLDEELGALPEDADERQDEERARDEKARALDELVNSRFGVLVGPAGTGKTTLLKLLTSDHVVASGGVLLLAPTGKARVQLQEATGHDAQTLAQFLLRTKRYDPRTGWYSRSDSSPFTGAKTVIIDEASMLTEEQLAATIDGLKGVDRLILVGDHRQLPPIGPGRPFVDVIRRCQQAGTGYAELTVHRRQLGSDRDDLDFAAWFTSGSQDPGSDDVWARIDSGEASDTVTLLRWDSEEELTQRVLEVLKGQFGIVDGDHLAFADSLGATVAEGGYAYFNLGCAEQAERWQILSPLRSRASGVSGLNRMIQQRFRQEMLEFARSQNRIPKPVGTDEIVYGDKVMCVRNHRRPYWAPGLDGRPDGYVANGELGMVVGNFRKKRWGKRPWQVNVEFSSQEGRSYTFGNRDFGERGDLLELAYAITVHKAQGSQFDTTILVLPNPCVLLSPELIYTALTRQRENVFVLHQGDLSELRQYASPDRSVTARRLTNLFEPPKLVEIDGQPLDGNLVHRTARGEAVRSKSEVIIANALHYKGVDYLYEQPLVADDGSVRWPDFTIEDEEAGEVFYWEHLGMLHTARYRRKWERKLEWYASNGVLPREEGGGPAGTLVTSRDSASGHLDSQEIDMLVASMFC